MIRLVQKPVCDELCNAITVANGDGRRLAILLGEDLAAAVLEKFDRFLPDGQHNGVLRHLAEGQLEDVVVIAAGETAVARDDDVDGLAGSCLPEIGRFERAARIGDLVHRLVERGEIRAAGDGAGLRAAELGGRDQLHGFRDLSRGGHGLDAGLDRFCG